MASVSASCTAGSATLPPQIVLSTAIKPPGRSSRKHAS